MSLTAEQRAKAVAWHENKAKAYERWAGEECWKAEQREEFALWAKAEWRNAADYRSGRINETVLESLREIAPL